jgi:hypothetical protein
MVLNTGSAGIVTVINVHFNYAWSGFKIQTYLSAFHLFLLLKAHTPSLHSPNHMYFILVTSSLETRAKFTLKSGSNFN